MKRELKDFRTTFGTFDVGYVSRLIPMKRELKVFTLQITRSKLLVSRLIPMKRELKAVLAFHVTDSPKVSRLIPMKRELKDLPP